MQARLVRTATRHRQVLERDRIEVVVGERDEPEAEPSEIDDFLDNTIDSTLPGLLPIGAPDRTKRAVLRASANGLD